MTAAWASTVRILRLDGLWTMDVPTEKLSDEDRTYVERYLQHKSQISRKRFAEEAVESDCLLKKQRVEEGDETQCQPRSAMELLELKHMLHEQYEIVACFDDWP